LEALPADPPAKGNTMSAPDFDEPVAVLLGLGFARSVANVMTAYQIVADWPSVQPRKEQVLALEACRAVLKGEGDVVVARQAFVDFAERAGILLGDAPIPVAPPELPADVMHS
jgi:hypothetical protein